MSSIELAAWLQFAITLLAAAGVFYIHIRQKANQKNQDQSISGIREDIDITRAESGRIKGQLTTIERQTNHQLSTLQAKLDATEIRLQHALVSQAQAQADSEGAEARSERLRQAEPPT